MCSAVDGVRGDDLGRGQRLHRAGAARARPRAAMMDALLARARAGGRAGVDAVQRRGRAASTSAVGLRRRGRPRICVFPPAHGDAARRRRRARSTGVGDACEPVRRRLRASGRRRRSSTGTSSAGAPTRRCWRARRCRALGARAGSGVAYWAADWKSDSLLVLLARRRARGRSGGAGAGGARTAAARRSCARCGCGRSRGRSPARADLGGDRVHRAGSLPMIAPFAVLRAGCGRRSARRLGLTDVRTGIGIR